MWCAAFLPTLLLLLSAHDLDPVEPDTKVLDIGHHMNWSLAPLRRITHDTAVLKTYHVLGDR